MELCRACSPIFWMALKYTSAASERAAGEARVQAQRSICATLMVRRARWAVVGWGEVPSGDV